MRILVTGATGHQGGAVASTLHQSGHHVRALTRDRSKPAAQALQEQGIEVVPGNFDDSRAMEVATRGMDGAFVMSTPFESGPEAEARQGISAIDAVQQSGVQHIVYTSVSDADQGTGIPHFESKRRVEEHLEGLDAPYTIVAPVFFRENLMADWMAGGLREGRLDLALPSDRGLQNIEVAEIGRFVRHVFEHRDDWLGRRINIASDESSPQDMAQALSEVIGRQIRHNQIPIDQVKRQNEDMARMFQWFNDVGYSADIQGLRQECPDAAWRRFPKWARNQDWRASQRVAAKT